ncbi:cubilin-like, partial [Limulus polyphemus]|uniref:Cubilin-like n=1 Tax=Limulus polyphemus TaxID=6850 RepID=A0ABM1TR64_LIMPO
MYWLGLKLRGFVVMNSLILFPLFVPSKLVPEKDICQEMNGKKQYFEAGQKGIITLVNLTSETEHLSASRQNAPQRCSVELITCPSCHFVITFHYLNLPTCSDDDSCWCDYIQIHEPYYRQSRQKFCGISTHPSTRFESLSKLLVIDLFYSFSHTSAFKLEFKAADNSYVYEGSDTLYLPSMTGYIESPFFPDRYPSDYSAEYIIRNLENDGFIQLVFFDFLLSPWSFIE